MLNQGFLEKLWYASHPLSVLLLPISWLYRIVITIRSGAYRSGLIPSKAVEVPVIVVGNLTVGGTGKTPFIIWLCLYLREKGHKPGILSRGYGGVASARPQQVRADSDPYAVGDEPVLLARRTGCPVAVSPRRTQAATELLQHTDCDVLLCDDGLQHLALDRDMEIVIIDGERRFGNGRCLPAGPLREPLSRLATVDMLVCNGEAGRNEYSMDYRYHDLVLLTDETVTMSVNDLRGSEVHAVAGLGNPGRFYSYLRRQDIRVHRHSYPDHYAYVPADLEFGDNLPVIMTEKDAVKCRQFAADNVWYLPVDAVFSDVFHHRIQNLLEELFNG